MDLKYVKALKKQLVTIEHEEAVAHTFERKAHYGNQAIKIKLMLAFFEVYEKVHPPFNGKQEKSHSVKVAKNIT